MGKEFELKFAANAAKQALILEEFGNFSEISMETTYYDTADRDISAHRLTLRRRLENGLSVCTLKAPAGPNSRREFEVEEATIEAAIPALCKLSGWKELEVLAAKGLSPICGARFTRRAKTLCLPDCTVEIALDAGVLAAGERTVPLCEVEVELKSGSEAAATAFAFDLARRFALIPEPKSKFRRAYDLAAENR